MSNASHSYHCLNPIITGRPYCHNPTILCARISENPISYEILKVRILTHIPIHQMARIISTMIPEKLESKNQKTIYCTPKRQNPILHTIEVRIPPSIPLKGRIPPSIPPTSQNPTQCTLNKSESHLVYPQQVRILPSIPPTSHNPTQYTSNKSESHLVYPQQVRIPPSIPPTSQNPTQYTPNKSESLLVYLQQVRIPPSIPPTSHNPTQYTPNKSESLLVYPNKSESHPCASVRIPSSVLSQKSESHFMCSPKSEFHLLQFLKCQNPIPCTALKVIIPSCALLKIRIPFHVFL